jgi:hypothetical protein
MVLRQLKGQVTMSTRYTGESNLRAPENCTIILIDHQPLQFAGAQNIDQTLLPRAMRFNAPQRQYPAGGSSGSKSRFAAQGAGRKEPGIVQLPEVSGIDENPGRTMLPPCLSRYGRRMSGKMLLTPSLTGRKRSWLGLSKTKSTCGRPDALLRQQ